MLLVCCLKGPAQIAHSSRLLLQLLLVVVRNSLMLLQHVLQVCQAQGERGPNYQGHQVHSVEGSKCC